MPIDILCRSFFRLPPYSTSDRKPGYSLLIWKVLRQQCSPAQKITFSIGNANHLNYLQVCQQVQHWQHLVFCCDKYKGVSWSCWNYRLIMLAFACRETCKFHLFPPTASTDKIFASTRFVNCVPCLVIKFNKGRNKAGLTVKPVLYSVILETLARAGTACNTE